MTPPNRRHHRSALPLGGFVVAILLCLVGAPPAAATVRYAVPGGSSGGATCTSPGDQCSLRHVLEDVILTADEVVVMPGTHDVGSNTLYVRTGSNSVNIHGEAGQPRPTITGTVNGFVFSLCLSTCPADLSVIRHLKIQNLGVGGALFVYGGSIGNPVTIDDVEVVAGTGQFGNAILAFARLGVASEAIIRNTVAYAPNTNSSGNGAISGALNLTLRNVTAVAPNGGAHGLSQGPMCDDGAGCSGNTTTRVFNSILAGGPTGGDVRTNSSTNGCGICFGNVSLDYSNFDNSFVCPGCSVSAAGSAHNQTAPSLLVGGDDVHQQVGSPTIDAGVDDAANGSSDFDGNPRRLGAATDIGAFEDGHPRTTTEAATNITETGATLRGSVDPLGFATTYYFDWGPTTAYGNRIPATAVSAGSGSGAQAVAQDLGGLGPGTTVHYRLVAANTFGQVTGTDQSFTTLVPPQAQPPAGGSPTPTTQSAFAGVRLTATRLAVLRGRYVVLVIRCPAGLSSKCVGKVKLVTASAVTLPRLGTAAAAKKKLTLGSASFSVKSGATKKVKLTLSKTARRLVRAKRSVKAIATLTATAGGQTKKTTQKVSVRLPRKR
jgi:hypothetical protein